VENFSLILQQEVDYYLAFTCVSPTVSLKPKKIHQFQTEANLLKKNEFSVFLFVNLEQY